MPKPDMTIRLRLLRLLLNLTLRVAASCIKRREIVPDADFMHLWNRVLNYHVVLGGWDGPRYPDADGGRLR